MTDQRLGNREWRINHLYKIKDKKSNLIQFKLNRAQQEFDANKHSRNLILKSRQLGFTTLEAIDMLDNTLFTRNFDGLFIAQDLEVAKDIFDNKIKLAWDNFDLQSLYAADLNSARRIKLGFGDGTSSSITVDNTGRSGTFHRLHVTEFAQVCKKFSDKAKEILEGSIPAVPLNGRVDIESTAEGSEGKFYELFWEAWERGKPEHLTEFKAHFFNWTYDDAEIAEVGVISNLPKEMRDYQNLHNLNDNQISYFFVKWLSLNRDWSEMKKEYPTTVFEAFEGSGNKLFDSGKLDLFQIKEGEKSGDWIYYEEPELGHIYAMGCDVAEGVGQDSSTCVVWDFTPIKPVVVAIYKNNRIAPDLFAFEIKDGGLRYHSALIAVERNNHGHTTISKLKEIYPLRCIYSDEKGKLGWETNLVSKPKMMFDLKTATNDSLIEIPSKPLVSEMYRYDKEQLNTKRFDEEATQHWDLLTGAAIGFQMKSERMKPQKATTFVPKPYLNVSPEKRNMNLNPQRANVFVPKR